MSEDNKATQLEEDKPSPLPKQRGIGASAALASFIAYIVAGVLITIMNDFDSGFIFGCVNFFITLPFTAVTVLIYRRARFPSRFEIFTATLGGLVGLLCVGFWLSSR